MFLLAAETEPNNSASQATQLALNGTDAGSISPANDVDWWKVTTTGNGRLDINVNSLNGKFLNIYLVDSNGTTVIKNAVTNTNYVMSVDGLATGSYYIKLVPYYATEVFSYTIANTFTPVPQAGELEPNSLPALAIPLSLNAAMAGNVGYYYNNQRDSSDWYKLNLSADGLLKLKISAANNQQISIHLFDNNGTTIINNTTGSTAFSLSTDGLAAGSYYVRVKAANADGFMAYTLTDSLFTPTQLNDQELNNYPDSAVSLPVNSITTGHLGYYYNLQRDTTDWYKLVTTKDGMLSFRLNPTNGQYITATLYDSNAVTSLKTATVNTPSPFTMDGLAAGTYFLKINMYYNYSFTAYTLTDSLVTPAQANDIEPNNSFAQAIGIALNSTKAGHIGYYNNLKRDSADWYKLVLNKDGLLKLKLQPVDGTAVNLALYDNNGSTMIANSQGGSLFYLTQDGLAAGTYYIKVQASSASNFTPYTLTDSLFAVNELNDAEPNNTLTSANLLRTDTTITGHVGFYYNLKRDSTDYYKIRTGTDGKMKLNITPINGQYLTVALLDSLGSVVKSSYANVPFVVEADGLAKATYFVKVFAYYGYGFSPYILSDSLTAPNEVNDVEPNNNTATASFMKVYSTVTGHVGYTFNGVKDAADWYKITTGSDGLLRLKANPGNGQQLQVTLYDKDGLTSINSSYSNSLFYVNADGLAAGTYYMKVAPLYSTGFVPYTITDSLILPAELNDSETNNSFDKAAMMTVNSTITGHVGYYNDLRRDSADWFRIVTPADGFFKLNITPVNGQYTTATLYDSDGTTLLKSGYHNVPFEVTFDGLAAGTFYIKINAYYPYGFTPYILTNTLVVPAEYNDAEPNNDPVSAIPLTLNNTVTGHAGYYSNHRRDSSDWYKISTTVDGMIQLNLSPGNNQYLRAEIFDTDGTTQIKYDYSNTKFDIKADGLAAGAYYVKVTPMNSTGFVPYTLTDSLMKYVNPIDTGDNNRASKSQLIASKTMVKGHVGFYNSRVRDSADWYKINLTSYDSLRLNLDIETRKSDGAYPYVWVWVYKDTAQGPIYSSYFNVASTSIKIAQKGPGVYYIKVFPYYSYEFASYSLSNQTADAAIAAIGLVKATVAPGCTTQSLQYKITKGTAPFYVQLYRYNQPYGYATSVGSLNTVFSFDNLPPGTYYATAYSAGATGDAFGKSVSSVLVPWPLNVGTRNKDYTYVTLTWERNPCVKYYRVQYRPTIAGSWIIKNTVGNVDSLKVTNLIANTQYQFYVSAVDSANKISAISKPSDTLDFVTVPVPVGQRAIAGESAKAANEGFASSDATINIYPNPVTTKFKIDTKTGLTAASLVNMNGVIVWAASSAELTARTLQVDVSALSPGIYQVVMIDKSQRRITRKISVVR